MLKYMLLCKIMMNDVSRGVGVSPMLGAAPRTGSAALGPAGTQQLPSHVTHIPSARLPLHAKCPSSLL